MGTLQMLDRFVIVRVLGQYQAQMKVRLKISRVVRDAFAQRSHNCITGRSLRLRRRPGYHKFVFMPRSVKISEGSFGLQIGYKASDLVLFFVTERSTQVLLDKKTSFGGTLKYAAGPTGGQTGATTDKQLSSDVYIYAKNRGLFGGMSLEGVRLGASPKALRKYYGHYIWPGQILFEHDIPTVPPEAAEFQRGLNEQPWE